MNIKDLQPGSYKVLSTPTNINQLQPGSYTQSGFPSEQPAEVKKSFLDKIKGIGGALISSEKTFGKAISTVFDRTSGQAVADINKQDAGAQQSLMDAIRKETDPAKRNRLAAFLRETYGEESYQAATAGQFNEGFDLTNKQVVGAAGGVALDVLTAGSYGKAMKSAQTGKLLTSSQKAANTATKVGVDVLGDIAKPTVGQKASAFGKGFAKAAVKSSPVGVGYGATGAMQDNANTKDIIKSGITGGLISGFISGVFGGRAGVKAETNPYKAQELHKKAIAQYKKGLGASKEKYKEMSDDIVPQLLKDKKWGTRAKLLRDAEAGIKLSERQYNELGELQGVAEIDDILTKIDDAMKKLKTPQGKILSVNTNKYRALQGLKSDISQYISAEGSRSNASFQQLQSSFKTLEQQKRKLIMEGAKETSRPVKDIIKSQEMIMKQLDKSIIPVASQEELRGLAQQYGDLLYDSRKSQKTISDNASLSQIKKGDALIRKLLSEKNPTYAKINEIYNLNSNLQDILNETAQRDSSGLGTRITRDIIGAGSGMAAGAMVGGIPGAVLGTIVTSSAVELLQSAWWNTMRAVQKERIVEKLLSFDQEKRNQAIIRLGRFGAKAASDLGLLD